MKVYLSKLKLLTNSTKEGNHRVNKKNYRGIDVNRFGSKSVKDHIY